jgi:hypothetical protein
MTIVARRERGERADNANDKLDRSTGALAPFPDETAWMPTLAPVFPLIGGSSGRAAAGAVRADASAGSATSGKGAI